MNRFEYIPAKLFEDESYVSKEKNVKLYDGDEKVSIKRVLSIPIQISIKFLLLLTIDKL